MSEERAGRRVLFLVLGYALLGVGCSSDATSGPGVGGATGNAGAEAAAGGGVGGPHIPGGTTSGGTPSGGTTSGGTTSGGTTSGGGASGSTAVAGSPAGGTDTGGMGAGQLRRGAASVDFQSPAGCVDPAATINLPPGAVAPVDAGGVHALVTNDDLVGGDMATVSCVVSRSKDGTWMTEGQIALGKTVKFAVYAHNAVADQRNVAGFSIYAPVLTRQHSTQPGSESGVTFTLLEPGRMAGTIDVPHLFNFKDDTECVLGRSYFYFENCALSYADF